MLHTNERSLQRDCLKHARSLGMFARKVETPNYAGFPDCLLINEGTTFFVEFKHPNGTGRLSALQKNDHATLENHGANVYVIDSYAGFTDLCRKTGSSNYAK
jgi:hypothetical protein